MLRLPIEGQGISLREFNDADITAVAKIAATPGFNFYALAPNTASQAEIEESAAQFVKHMQELSRIDPITNIRENYKLAVTEIMSPEKLIGYVALDEWSEHRGEKRDIGYFTDPTMQGKGIATLASTLLLERFFAATTYDLVHATVHPENKASKRILQKLGYREISSMTKPVRGIIEPRIILTLSKNDFFAVTEPLRNKTMEKNLVKLPLQKGVLDNV